MSCSEDEDSAAAGLGTRHAGTLDSGWLPGLRLEDAAPSDNATAAAKAERRIAQAGRFTGASLDAAAAALSAAGAAASAAAAAPLLLAMRLLPLLLLRPMPD
jgi:hypothetical protein